MILRIYGQRNYTYSSFTVRIFSTPEIASRVAKMIMRSSGSMTLAPNRE